MGITALLLKAVSSPGERSRPRSRRRWAAMVDAHRQAQHLAGHGAALQDLHAVAADDDARRDRCGRGPRRAGGSSGPCRRCRSAACRGARCGGRAPAAWPVIKRVDRRLEAERGRRCRGMSWTTPSVIRMAPATRSGGTSARPDCERREQARAVVSPAASPRLDHAHLDVGQRGEAAAAAAAATAVVWRGALVERLRGRAVDDDGDDVLQPLALLAHEGRVEQAARRTAPRPARAAPRRSGARPARGWPPRRRSRAPAGAAAAEGAISDEVSARSSSSLAEPFEQGGHVHLVGLVVAGQRVHHDVDAGAEGHLALAGRARRAADRAARRAGPSPRRRRDRSR